MSEAAGRDDARAVVDQHQTPEVLPPRAANPPHKKLFLEVGLLFQLGVRHEMSSGFRDASANTFDDVIAGLDPAIHPAISARGDVAWIPGQARHATGPCERSKTHDSL